MTIDPAPMSDVDHALDSHDRRRTAGRSTLSTVVAATASLAASRVFEWATERKLAVANVASPIEMASRRWFLSAMGAQDPLNLIARPIAMALGTNAFAILHRLHDDALPILPPAYRGALANDPATRAILTQIRPDRSSADIWDALLRDLRGLNVEDIVAACLHLLAPDRGPVLLFESDATESLLAGCTIGARLIEAAPTLRVTLATSSAAYEGAIAKPGHGIDLMRDAAIRLARTTDANDPKLAALLDEARAWRETVSTANSPPSSREDAARSAAERALFYALESHRVTRGRFELNGVIDRWFGNRPAEIDLLARTELVAIEVDGYYHFQDAESYRRDRRKDLLMQQEGYFVIRVLADDVSDRLDDLIATIVPIVSSRISSALGNSWDRP